METANKVTAPMYIANPFRGKKAANLYSTHPPIEERIRILRNISHGAALADYEKSYEETTNRKGMIPKSGMKPEKVDLRKATEALEPLAAAMTAATGSTAATAATTAAARAYKTTTPKEQARQMGDIMRKVNHFTFLTCSCGLKLKIPPTFKAKSITCPRCKTKIAVQD